jgi:glycosyltransferase involved in cell wall biosynthesis
VRVVRIYHAGRDEAHRARERSLVAQGVELRLVVPTTWPGPSSGLAQEPFDVVQLDVERPGDVNRHRYSDREALHQAIRGWRPDVVDLHEEPVSVVARQALQAAEGLPVVMYTAQNLDKRWPPPFASMERRALTRTAAFYPCSRQAASVLRGKGFRGPIEVLPLGIDLGVHRAGSQDLAADPELVLGLVGRLVPEKGLSDALDVLAAVRGSRPARLLVVGQGPDEAAGRAHAAQLGVADAIEWQPWLDADGLAAAYRRMHVVLVPSRATATWVEQFGRVITEGMANGAVPVGYASGSISEVTGREGVLAPEGDVDALTAAVLDLSVDPARWAALRSAGLQRAAGLDWLSVARGMVEMYEQALRGGAPLGVRPDRAAAVREFGPTARTNVSDRPFALPVLRESPLAHRILEPVADLVGRR